MTVWRTVGIAVASAATVVLAACGSSNGGSPTDSGAAHGTPIPVGVVGSYSGFAASSISGARDSIQAWADSVNAAGGIDGRPIKLYIEDDGGSTSTSVTAVKRLVEQDNVVAIVGQASLNADPWASYVEQKGIPVVGGNTAATTYLSNPDFFSVGGNLVSNFYGVAAVAKQSGADLGNLYCAEIPACAATVPLLSTFGKSVGVSVKYATKVSASAPDFTAPCQGLTQSDVSAYTLGLATATLKRVAAACQQQGVRAQLILSNVADSTFTSDPAFDGTKMVDGIIPFFDQSSAATRDFHAAMAKYAPSVGGSGSPYNEQVTTAWVSGKLFEAAVAASGTSSITPDSVKKGLYAMKNQTLGGLAVPLSFTPGKPSPHDCYFVYGIKNGSFVEPQGAKPQCAPAALVNEVIAKLPS
jgi:branched-chain amino acid transport system substrate-binding protein